ncbi:NAD-dependent protein deacylase [Loigolactobacillus zhaoyuanensis]|uniref:protein acetyllysine N-acetyltransferase n=1 Tax=Loigolactobacillus zhaoyuanensis TaxID=2486017 RepID=A0ABW8UAV3_9LACO|nr:NAD-dependent protein deacylase [Loigolactobacillus zhaoyuanensis]
MVDLKAAIKAAKFVTFLTGAGVSTASGIPDYRSKNGLYANQQDPEYLLSTENLQRHPADFYQFVKSSMYYPQAKPNAIHEKMAAISNEKGAIVTQNVDGLHRAAGAKNVVEFHGNLYHIYCQKCHETFTYQQYLKSDQHAADGGILRPDIVLYGEALPEQAISQAITAVGQADLIVICGTSFRVAPFSLLVNYAQPGAQVIAVNEEKLDLPFAFEMVQADALDVFQQL